jgi:hypothetical protein
MLHSGTTRCLLVVFLFLGGFSSPTCHGSENDKPAKQPTNDTLRQELLRMVKEDQDARNTALMSQFTDAAALRQMEEIDRKHLPRLKEIVQQYGWPGRSLVGEDGSHAAWLLLQHADRDRDFQKRCLKLLQAAVKAAEASGAELAYLTDRVRVGDKKKQVYGTQFRQVEGKLEAYPIEDEANVDQRRKEVGLPPLAEYRQQLEEIYRRRPPESK